MPDLQRAIEAMDRACRVWSLGYDQGNRQDIRDGGEADCSSLVIWALEQGGFDVGDASYTGNLSENLTKRGWIRLPADLSTVRPGDILLNDLHHVCMVISGYGLSATIAQASIDERGKASGGRAGDQTGYETNEKRIYTYRHGWDCILRWSGAQPSAAKKPPSPQGSSDGTSMDQEEDMAVIVEPRNGGKAVGYQAYVTCDGIVTLTKPDQAQALADVLGVKTKAITTAQMDALKQVLPVSAARA